MTLDRLFQWSLGASTQIAILIFLGVGVATTVWTLVLRPLLETYSEKYQRHLGIRQLRVVRPLLEELGLPAETAAAREFGRLSRAQSGLPETEHERRLLDIMKRCFRDGNVRLGKHHSDDNAYFIDLRSAAMNADDEEVLADALASVVGGEIQRGLLQRPPVSVTRLVGMKEGNPLLAGCVARKLRMPLALYRGADFPTFHGSADAADRIDGVIQRGDAVLLLDDCTFRGTTLEGAKQTCQDLGASVAGVCLLFEPANGIARGRLDKFGIPLNAAVVVTEPVLKTLRKR